MGCSLPGECRIHQGGRSGVVQASWACEPGTSPPLRAWHPVSPMASRSPWARCAPWPTPNRGCGPGLPRTCGCATTATRPGSKCPRRIWPQWWHDATRSARRCTAPDTGTSLSILTVSAREPQPGAAHRTRSGGIPGGVSVTAGAAPDGTRPASPDGRRDRGQGQADLSRRAGAGADHRPHGEGAGHSAQHPARRCRGAERVDVCELDGEGSAVDRAVQWLRDEGVQVDLLGDVVES